MAFKTGSNILAYFLVGVAEIPSAEAAFECSVNVLSDAAFTSEACRCVMYCMVFVLPDC